MRNRVFAFILATFILIAILFICGCENSTSDNDTDVPATGAPDTGDVGPIQPAEVKMLPAEDVRVMSINVYMNEAADHADGMMKLIREAAPDSFGTQEFLGDWFTIFEGELTEYTRVGYNTSKEESRYADAAYIFYKTDKYNCLAWDTFFLTDTPTIISGVEEVNGKCRTCTWAILENKETGFRYAHVNCHLESASDEVNAWQMPMVRDQMLRFIELGFPVFATGDFNTREGGDTYHIMVDEEKIGDPKFLTDDTMDIGTHNGFGRSDYENGKPIDFCFVSEDVVTVKDYKVIVTYVDGIFVSDHNAVVTNVTAHSLPDQYALVPDYSIEGISENVTSVRPYVVEFNFTQADELLHVVGYRISAVAADGTEADVRHIPSMHLDKNVPDDRHCELTGLSPDTEYTVKIAPMSAIGTYGNAYTFTVKTPPLN